MERPDLKLHEILLSENVCEEFHKTYDNDKNFNSWLRNFLPEVEDCKNMKQNNPWHIYNVLDHILHSVEEINKQTEDLPYEDRKLLAYTMFLHDIGKPACHLTRMKDGKMIDSFFKHNIESRNITYRSAYYFDFNINEIDIIAKLVEKHDIFMFIKEFDIPSEHLSHWRKLTPGLIEREIEDLNSIGNGAKYFDYLVKIGIADNRAQNPEMAGESLHMLKSCQKMLAEREMTK